MRFAVVTPILDGRDYLRACCASVAAQGDAVRSAGHTVTHYIRESSRSVAPSEDIAAEYGCDYKRAPDTGLYDAIAQGLNAATADGAEILSWLNADEQYLPGAFDALCSGGPVVRRRCTATPLQFIFGDYLITDPSVPRILAVRREIPARKFYLRHGVNYIMSCATFFTRETWLKHGPFDLSYKLLADKKFYFKALENGAVFKHIPAWLGCYGATGGNASFSPIAPAERARLRDEIGAYKSPAIRKTIRALRIMEKILRGCHTRRRIATTLHDSAGAPHRVSGVYTGRWVDK
ncbi:MAG: hypothetical protein FWG05_02115 [Kiritimatiellaeota bacterium]|nr:hypothetical protein [Kiritimatiellota bacterium]